MQTRDPYWEVYGVRPVVRILLVVVLLSPRKSGVLFGLGNCLLVSLHDDDDVEI